MALSTLFTGSSYCAYHLSDGSSKLALTSLLCSAQMLKLKLCYDFPSSSSSSPSSPPHPRRTLHLADVERTLLAAMSFAPRTGCPMCSIVATALHAPSHSPRTPTFPVGSKAPEILWRDDNFTIYRERANPVSSKGHLIVVFKCVPSVRAGARILMS